MSIFLKEIFGCQLREMFSTSGSRNYDLISIGKNLGMGATVGWIDIHYPCSDAIKLRVKASVPKRVVIDTEALQTLARLAIELVEADVNEQVEVCLFSVSNCTSMSSGNGAIETTHRYILPAKSTDDPE